MTADEMISYCLTKREAYVDYPFGEVPICVRVRGKIFAQLYPDPHDFKVTLKCDPMFADFYRQQYPGTVVRGYFCPPVQQPYWNTVILNGVVPDEELRTMIDYAYDAAISRLPKRVQRELKGN
ncbi:MmcQ/YjbR family DNA-binding protein [Caproiciproducens sp. LBM24188]